MLLYQAFLQYVLDYQMIFHLFEYIRDNHLTLSYGFGKFLIPKIKKNKEKTSKYSIVYLKEIKD